MNSSVLLISRCAPRVLRDIPLTTGGDFLDLELIKIAFRFVNNDATNDFNPIMGHPACLIKRIQLFANGQRTDDIDNYARSVHLYTLLKPREWWINQANEGFGINEVSNFPQPLPESHFQEVLMAPTLVGLLGCGKLLPPQLNLVLEIEWADAADVVRGGAISSVDYDIQNVRVLGSQVTLGILQPRSSVGPQPCVLLSNGTHASHLGASRLNRVQRDRLPRLLQASGSLRHLQNAGRPVECSCAEPPRHPGRWHVLPGVADGAGPHAGAPLPAEGLC